MKKIFVLVVFLLIFYFSSTPANASIVDVKPTGEVVVNVLGSEDSHALTIPKKESLQVTGSAANVSGNGEISLAQDNGKINLSVATPGGQKNMDVTGYKESVIQIEERNQAQQVEIGIVDGKFSIKEGSVFALTDFPITIDPKSAQISVSAPSGLRYLAILPLEAYQGLVKARIITKLASTSSLSILEGDKGELSYLVSGQKVVNVFNLFDYPVDVKANVSASTGEVLSVDEPIWLKVLGFALI